MTVVIVHWNQPERCATTLDTFRASTVPVEFIVAARASEPMAIAAVRRLAEAEAQLLALLGREPGFWRAHENLAGIYARTGQRDLERRSWLKLLEQRPNHRLARERLAKLQ